MSSEYIFKLTNGTTLGTVYSLEGNGVDAQSTPRQVLDIDFSTNPSTLIISGNNTLRFTAGFQFDLIGSNAAYNGTYVVGSSGSTLDIDNNTRIPLDVSTPLNALTFNIIAASVVGDTWTISGAANGNYLFYPSSIFNVQGNSVPAANKPYTTVSAVSSPSLYPIIGVAPGPALSGTFTVAGDQQAFFIVGQKITVANNSAAGKYTVYSVTLFGGDTVITVAELVSASATIAGGIQTVTTVITVSPGSIPAGADVGSLGETVPPVGQQLEFIRPTAVSLAGTNLYNVTWRVNGNYTSVLTPGFPIVIKDNSYYPYQPLTVHSTSYDLVGAFTNIVTQISSTVDLTPLVTGVYAESVTAVTTGASGSWSVAGNFTHIPALAPGKTFVIIGNSDSGSDLIYTIASVVYAAGQTVISIDSTLPHPAIPGSATVSGSLYISNGFLTFPIPTVPFGYAQYDTPNVLSPLQLVGKGSPMYNNTTSWGESIQNNQIHMLENFANPTAPTVPLLGQLWYDTNVVPPQLNLCDSVTPTWKSVLLSGVPSAGNLDMGTYKIINLGTPTTSTDAANKGYVDALSNGIVWIEPVLDPNLFSDILTAPPVIDTTIAYHKTYIVATGGSGAWVGLDGHAMIYDPTANGGIGGWVDILGRAVAIGDRFGVFCEPEASDPLINLPTGGLVGLAGKIVTILTTSPLTYTQYTPSEPAAFTVVGLSPLAPAPNELDRSPHYGHSYTFRGTWGSGTFGTDYDWIEFSGPMDIAAGPGMRFVGNRMEAVGTAGRIDVAASIDLAVSGVVAGSYTHADVTVDTYGRVTTIANGKPNAWTAKISAYPAVAGDRILVNTSGGAFSITLPIAPVLGDTVEFVDAASTFNVFALTVLRNGQTIMGSATDMVVNTQNISFSLVYYDITNGWRVVQ